MFFTICEISSPLPYLQLSDVPFFVVTFSGPEIIKLFAIYSAEHETFSANKYENANNSWHFHTY